MTQPGSIDHATVRAFLRDCYGADGELVSHAGEEACNVEMRNAGQRWMLKALPASWPHALAELQTSALLHAAQHGCASLLPRLVRTKQGHATAHIEHDGQSRSVFATTFLPGRAFADVAPLKPALLRSVGRALGQLSRALSGFDHPAAHRELRWDLLQSEWIGGALDAIAGEADRELVASVHAQYVAEWQAPLRHARMRTIHGDANDQNLLVEEDATGEPLVTGIIDFGDMCRSALVCDVAIAATYACLRHEHPLAAIGEVVAGFDEQERLLDSELALVLPLVLTRLAVSVTTAAVRRRDGTADAYALINEPEAWAMLRRLRRFDCLDLRIGEIAVRKACGRAPWPHGQRVRAWIEANAHTFAQVLPRDLLSAPRAVIDLSFESLVAGDDPTRFDSAVCETRIGEQMARQQAKVGIGRYAEPRTIYEGDAFAGPTPHDERRTVHLGVDLFAHAGMLVHAPLDGEVVRAVDCENRLDYGGMVVLRHVTADGDAFGTLWGHLDPECATRLQSGQRIARGEAFARIGSRPQNGDWPPHLHAQLLASDPAASPPNPPGVSSPSLFLEHEALYPDPSPLLQLDASARWVANDQAAMRARRSRHFAPNLFISYREPVTLVRGHDHWMFDPFGRRHLDAYNNVPHVGHCNTRVADAVCTQTRLLATNTRYLNELQLAYAERLTALLPAPLSVCYFVASGSEANEVALRLVRAHTKRKDLLVMEHGYHGATTGAVDISPYKWGKGYVTKPDWAHKSVQPDVYRGAHRGSDAADRFADEVDAQIAQLRADGREIAAYLCECLPSVGGQVVMPDGFLRRVYAAVRSAGGLCIADDVQTALGRTGDYFFGFEQQGVVPDVLVLGKPLGNGFPLAAVVTTEAIRDSFSHGPEFFSTFGGSTVACAAGLAVLDELRDGSLQRNAKRQGERMLQGLRAMQREHQAIGDVRGLGLFLGIEMVNDRDTRAPAPKLARYVKDRMRERRILIGTDGPYDNVIKIRPPMTFDDAATDLLLTEIAAIFREDGAQTE